MNNIWYHGSKTKISKFSNEFAGAREATDQEGPGIYFTSSEKEARGYGSYVYKVQINPKKIVSTKVGKAPADEIRKLIMAAEDWEYHAQNYDENPKRGLEQFIKGLYDYNETPHDQFQQAWIDFYKDNPREYLSNMTKFGYSGVLIEKYDGIQHFVLFDPSIIKPLELLENKLSIRSILNEILSEAKQVGLVYHFTSLNNAIQILKSDILKAKGHTKQFTYRTVSTTRDKLFSKSRIDTFTQIASNPEIAFILDGDKLSNRYQTRSMDDSVNLGGHVDIDDKERFGDEAEQVWYGDKLKKDGGIKNISQYITKVIISKRLLDDIVLNPEKLIHPTNYNAIYDAIGKLDSYDITPQNKLKMIRSYFEDRGFEVELEK